jgi:hypothetical protein
MNTAALTPSAVFSTSKARATLGRAVLFAGLALGVLDALDGVAFFGLTAGLNPIQVLQYIASGALGASAYAGGLGTAAVGALLHFAISFVVAGVFVAAYSQLSFVRSNLVPVGLLFGAAVWVVMNVGVLPLSAIGAAPFTALGVLHGVIGHSLAVGLTGALVTRRVLG